MKPLPPLSPQTQALVYLNSALVDIRCALVDLNSGLPSVSGTHIDLSVLLSARKECEAIADVAGSLRAQLQQLSQRKS